MFSLIIGAILTLLPFLGILFCKNRLQMLILFLSGFFVFHTSIAFLTQAMHIFSYPVVITVNIIAIVVLFIFLFRSGCIKKKYLKSIRIPIVPIIAILIIIFQLSSLHFNYTGTVRTTNGVSQESESSYTYPYFSDEWIAASLVDYSIQNKSIPMVNALNESKPFPNVLVFSHSFISEIFLILNIDPVSDFAFISILFGVLVCFSIYLLLRSLKVSVFASSLAMLSIPYITNGANLPGIWFLMPFLISFILFLLSLSLFFMSKKRITFILSIIFSFLLYPPIAVLIIPVLLFGGIYHSWKTKFISMLLLSIASLVIIGSVSILLKSANVFNLIFSYIVRSNLVQGVPSFYIYNVLPLFLIPFVIIGLVLIFKKRISPLLICITVGFLFWTAYGFTTTVFIIEYARIVVMTSLILVVISGFGYDWCLSKLKSLHTFFHTSVFQFGLRFIILSGLLIAAFSYPITDSWEKLTLDVGIGRIINPAPPINRYLIQDDLSLFKDIKGSRFISPPWKGLVIGVATKNYPQHSKASTMSVNRLSYYNFINMDCENKQEKVNKFDIEYAYMIKTDCPGFIEIGSSDEGFFLYQLES